MAGAGGAVRLRSQLPSKVAMHMLFTGESLDATRAYELGLVSALVEPGTALDRAREIARSITAAAPVAVRATKAVALDLQDGVEAVQQSAWRRNETEFSAVLASSDAAEGTSAFREKRAPVWSGR